MEKLSRLCRICLSDNVQQIQNTQLQLVYEKLTGIKTNDTRPLEVCYICHARLNTTRKFMLNCQKADEVLKQMYQSLNNETEVDQKVKLKNRLSINSLQLSVSITEHNNIDSKPEDYNIKQEILNEQEADIKSREYLSNRGRNELDPNIKHELQDQKVRIKKQLGLNSLQKSATTVEHCNIDNKIDASNIKKEIHHEQESEIESPELLLNRGLNEPYTGVKHEYQNNETHNTEPHMSLEQHNIASDLEAINIKKEITDHCDEIESHYSNSGLIDIDIKEENMCGYDEDNKLLTGFEMLSKNAEKCKNYRKRKKEAALKIKTASKTSAERSRMYRMRKKQLALGSKLSMNEVLFAPSTSNSMNEPSPQPVTTEKPNIVLRIKKSKIQNYIKHEKKQKHSYRNNKSSDIQYNCNECQENFKTQSKLKEHIRIHIDEKLLPTSKSFKEESIFNEHKTIHNDEKQYTCDICKRNFNQKLKLQRHIQTHTGEKPYVCDVCSATFTYKSNLYRHSVIHSGERRFTCDICYKDFNRKGNLVKHIRVHIRDKSNFNTSDRSFNEPSYLRDMAKPYPCSICEKSFSGKSNLKEHLMTHTGEKPYSCDICQKSFISKSKIRLHIRTHTGEKPYVCKLCKKSFNENSKLRLHMRIHTGERPYSCDVCQKSFNRKSHLKGHTRIHTGEKPYSCNVCQKRFTESTALKKHIGTHTRKRKRRSNL